MHRLTPRQTDIAELLATGASNADIAAKLFISPLTVKRHVADILIRLDASTRHQAALLWLQATTPPCHNCGRKDNP